MQTDRKIFDFKRKYIYVLIFYAFLPFSGISQDFPDSPIFPDSLMTIPINDSVSLAGSLKISGNESPLVIFIAGSGPTDRNCNNSAGLKTDAFKMLADSLATYGYSSFRYDKRGIGASTAIKESSVVFDDFIRDASTIVGYFNDSHERIVVLGHSEGALIGSIVMNSNPNADAFISLSGPGKSLDSILLDQLARYPKLLELAEVHINEINNGDTLSEVHPLLVSLFRPSILSYLRTLFSYNPLSEISLIEKPLLIIGGECDSQVPATHALALGEVTGEKVVIIENMGHTLKQLNEDCTNNVASYSDPSMPLHSELIRVIVGFLNDHI